MCPIDSSTGTRTEADILITDTGKDTGVRRAQDFAVCGNVNYKTQLKFDVSDLDPGAVLTIKAGAGGSSTVTFPGDPGSGNVVGPGSSTDNAIARYDQTTGALLQDSSVTVNDDGDISTPGPYFQSTNATGLTIQMRNGLGGDESGGDVSINAGNAAAGGAGTAGDVSITAGIQADEATYGNVNMTGNVICNQALTLNNGIVGGATGSFTSNDGKTITVTGGVITAITGP